ncbi:hypothetical protein BS78_04G279300 [Paspalum vaginatum]|nr:hypothetical protein BS78_04G279300 [Paspalum vaginatum]
MRRISTPGSWVSRAIWFRGKASWHLDMEVGCGKQSQNVCEGSQYITRRGVVLDSLPIVFQKIHPKQFWRKYT